MKKKKGSKDTKDQEIAAQAFIKMRNELMAKDFPSDYIAYMAISVGSYIILKELGMDALKKVYRDTLEILEGNDV